MQFTYNFRVILCCSVIFATHKPMLCMCVESIDIFHVRCVLRDVGINETAVFGLNVMF